MSGSKPPVGIRVEIAGAEEAKRKLEDIKRAGSETFQQVGNASSAAVPQMERLGGSLGGLSRAAGLAGVSAAALGTAWVAASTAIRQAGDQAIATMARLSSAAGGLGAAQTAYEGLFRLSQQTGVSVADSAGAFSRFAVAAREIGGTNAQVLSLVAGIQKAGIVAGSSTEEIRAGVQQLGQALASGTLQGDELRSILENMPQLAQRLARELGVSLGQLKQMGSEGQLQADRVFPAMLKAAESMSAEFDKMPVTMSRASDILGAATQNFLARLDQITGMSQRFAGFMQAGAAALNSASSAIAPDYRQRAQNEVDLRYNNAVAISRDITQMEEGLARGRSMGIADDSPAAQLAQQRLAKRRAELDAENELFRQAVAMQRVIANDARRQETEERDAAFVQKQQATRTRAQTELDELVLKNDKAAKAQQEYWDAIRKIDAAEAAGVVKLKNGDVFTPDDQRIAAAQDYLDELQKLEKQAARTGAAVQQVSEYGINYRTGLHVTSQSDEKAQLATLKEIEKQNAQNQREAERATRELVTYQERSYNELANSVERAFDRLGDAIVDAFVSGQGAAVNWGNVTRGIIGSIASDLLKLGVVNPVINSFSGATGSAARPTLGGAGFGIGDLLGLGNISETLGLTNIGKSLGLSGSGGLLASTIWRTPGVTMGPLGEIVSMPVSLGSVLGGAGLGFGAGTLLNNVLGGNTLGGTIGSGAGSLAGAAIGSLFGGPLLGGLIGGLAGGGLGGLFGPNAPTQGWSYGLYGRGTSLALDNVYSSAAGAQQEAQARQAVEQINAFMTAQGLYASGARAVGGNRFGMGNLGYGEASSFSEAFSALRFGSVNDNVLSRALSSQAFADPAALQSFIGDYGATKATLEAATADPAKAIDRALAQVHDQFNALTTAAQRYGLSEDGLLAARERAVKALIDQAEAQDKANKATEEAAKAAQAEEERRKAEATRAAGASILSNLTIGSGSALTPSARYFAGLTMLNNARTALEGGGSLSDYGAVVSQVLPVARDFLGTSSRYAGLVADVAGTVARAGGDPNNMAAILAAQVGGTDLLRQTFASYGEQSLGVQNAMLAELRRFSANVEALIARRVA